MKDPRHPWAGLRPQPPPAALRTRVLAAAQDAARGPAPGLLTLLYRDRLLRVCAVTLVSLLIVDGLVVAHGRPSRAGARPVVADVGDGVVVPVDTGLTAAEQLDELAPLLGVALAGGRG